VFRRREGEDPLRGRMWVANSIVTVTAPVGRQKSTQLGGSAAESLARLMFRPLEKERLERLGPHEGSETGDSCGHGGHPHSTFNRPVIVPEYHLSHC
jgi:hypothetical protein